MLKPVYALIGEDPFLQTQKLLSLLAQLPADAQRLEVDGERAELADVLDELRSFAMFGSGKAVTVRNAEAFITRYREALEKYVASPSSSATLFLRLNALPANQRIYKLIDKLGGIEKCVVPKDLARWITEQGKTAHRVMVAPDAARLLADLVGADLGRLDNELAKLALQANGGKIDVQTVGASVAFQREQEMWHMTNELAAGKPAEALRRWRQLVQMDSSSEFRAVTWLVMWLENVRKALALKKEGQNAFTIAQQLRIWPREIQQPFFKTAEALGERGVGRALDLLAEVDHHSKSGVGEAATNVEDFLMSVAQLCRR
jgi:DNA polymerase III delta subunit